MFLKLRKVYEDNAEAKGFGVTGDGLACCCFNQTI